MPTTQRSPTTTQKKKNEELDHIKFKVRDMEERIIPEMMQEAGVSLLKLSDGSQVEVKPFTLLRFLSLELKKHLVGCDLTVMKI